MKRRDPLASPTLAHLYVEQGHYTKAKAVLDTVIADDPCQGQALALRERLASP